MTDALMFIDNSIARMIAATMMAVSPCPVGECFILGTVVDSLLHI